MLFVVFCSMIWAYTEGDRERRLPAERNGMYASREKEVG